MVEYVSFAFLRAVSIAVLSLTRWRMMLHLRLALASAGVSVVVLSLVDLRMKTGLCSMSETDDRVDVALEVARFVLSTVMSSGDAQGVHGATAGGQWKVVAGDGRQV
jgi:hypothetical protein